MVITIHPVLHITRKILHFFVIKQQEIPIFFAKIQKKHKKPEKNGKKWFIVGYVISKYRN